MLAVQDLPIGVAVLAFLQGTILMPFKESLTLKQPTTLADLFAHANRYVV